MATKKETFPHPPLEVGVPQYPTPLVPNFNNKQGGWNTTEQGHIVLVEKVSAEKGAYNPQPLDGSVTYTKRDANKWPSTLYLVFQQPDATGEFVLNFWANDRSMASQDKWNYGVSYSSEHPDYPIYTREYIIPRSSYHNVTGFPPFTLGSVDPIFGTAIVAKQQMAELPEGNPLRSRYVAFQVVYETIAGPALGGTITAAEYGPAIATKQVVVAGTAAPSASVTTIKSEVSPVDAVKSSLDTASYSSLNTLVGYQYDEFFQQNLQISKSLVAAGASAPSTGNGVLSYKDDPVNYYQTQRTIVSTPALPPTRTEYHTGTFQSPTLVFGIAVESQDFSDPCGSLRDVRIKLTPDTRSAQSRQTVFKTVTSYSYGPPSAGDSGLLSPILKEVAYTGYVINFNLGSALCDRIYQPNILVATCDSGAGSFYESWDINYTSPTASGYLALVGTYQKISWEAKYFKANIWREISVYVLVI